MGVSGTARASTRVEAPRSIETRSDWAPKLPPPSVHSVDASPSALDTAFCGLTEPAPSPGAKDTTTPGTPVPPWSATCTATGSGNVVPATASWPLPERTRRTPGTCSTVTDAVAVTAPADACNWPEPFATAVTVPELSTVKTEASELVHDTSVLTVWPPASRTVARKDLV